jgi:hypothetical protein
MYLIGHSTSSRRRWVSGIFQDKSIAKSYLASIPPNLDPQLREYAIDRYPVYLLEANGIEFTLYGEEEINAYINNITLADEDDEDRLYANIYHIKEDWQSPRPGTDSMGNIRHIHLDDRGILRVRDSGIAKEF